VLVTISAAWQEIRVRFGRDDNFVAGGVNCRSLGFARGLTKGGWGFHSRDQSTARRDRLHGSQVSKARPGAPFDFAFRFVAEGELCYFSPHSLPGVGSGMTKGGVEGFIWRGFWSSVAGSAYRGEGRCSGLGDGQDPAGENAEDEGGGHSE
jgi:hypothetical protein